MMRFLLLLVYVAHVEQVIVQELGVSRLILKDGKNPCEGHVKIYHNSTWGYAGDKYWNKFTEEVVCRSIHCGKPIPNSAEDIVIQTGSKIWLNEMVCIGNERHLWDCSLPGWGISVYRKDTVKKITCSDKINISLDGFGCAGAVQYSINESSSGYFCADNWGQREADRLCESLKCGKSKEIPQKPLMVFKEFQNKKKMMIKCSGIENEIDNLWQCVTQESPTCENPAFIICQDHERLQLSGNSSNVCSGTLKKEENGIWKPKSVTSPNVTCQQMHCGNNGYANGTQLTCTDKVSVQLVDGGRNPTYCYGTVSIKVNDLTHPVCASNWNKMDSEVVCRELNCGKVIITGDKDTKITGIMDDVNCSGSESSLWHCRAKRDNKPFPCSSSAYVVCEKSLDVRLIDGPGRCAGRVEIQYEGGWKQVNTKGWTDDNSNRVCKQLKCGNKGKTEKFSQGSGDFFPKTVDCQANSSNIYDCIRESSSSDQREEKEAVGLICEDHKVVFWDGNNVCSGMVGIEHGSNTYWLSGSNETWNRDTANIVCQQMHCGNVIDFTSISSADKKNDVWNTSLNCLPEHKSLFECENENASPDYNATIASVTCSGKITVTLSNRCWGHVNVSVDGKWGGVCADAWKDAQFQMLCKDLGCGDKISAPNNRPGGIEVILKSLHATKKTTKLNQCNFVKNNEKGNACQKGPAYVVCSGSLKPRLSDSRDKCSGNVEVSYEGKWLPVCEEALQDPNTQNTICAELECGQPVTKITYFGPTPKETLAISELTCPNSGVNLKACNITSKSDSCTFTGLQCSEWRKVKLTDTCSGDVFVHTRNGCSPVSFEGWTQSEGDRLCKDLDCGKSMPPKSYKTPQKTSFWSGNFACANVTNPKSIWDCENNALSTQEQQLYIECEDKPSVTLSRNCRGDVTINKIEACSTTWNEDYSHLFCQEQDCSNAVIGLTMSKDPKPNAEYYHVMCEDYHYKLGQCKRYKGKCNGKLVTVSCVKSVKFRTTQKCGGAIQVNYQANDWEEVCPMKFSPEILKKLCQNVECGDYNVSITGNTQKLARLKTTLDCTEDHMDIKHCVYGKPCGESKPAEIYCNGYVAPPPTKPPPPPPPVVQIILGIGVVLILVILIVIFVRIYLIKKARNAMKVPLRMMSQKEVEFESGEFEDIKENEMEDFNHGRFRPEDEVIMENNRRSTSSFPYDDIDEVTESQPLTSQATIAGASGGNYSHEDQNGVTYEVEDPQESYDDIDASPEITETKAEVHDSPQPTPESSAVAPHQLKQEGDYLVPGQDG